MTSMPFQHKFSKIHITVNQGTSGIDLNTLTGVTLKGMPASATVRLADLAALPPTANESQIVPTLGINGATADITAYIDPATKTSTQAIAEAIIAPHTVGADKKIEFTIVSETKTYTFDPAFTFESGKRYDFVFTLQASGPEPDPQPETTSVDGMTNCYMVIPGEDVTFEVSRAYEYDGTDFTNRLRVANTADYTDGFVAKVIWQDPSDLIVSPTSTASADAMFGTGNTAKVTVQTNNKSGNALVGIYKSTDTSTPVWSYHIWVTTYTGTPTASNNGFVFMNRNLGATATGADVTACGLFYQWGRKDPFPGNSSGSAGYTARTYFYGINESGFNTSKKTVTDTSQTEDGITSGIIESIKNPTTFYSTINNSWLPMRKRDLWNYATENANMKTIYDPCPIGWRVPLRSSTSPWADMGNGTIYDTYVAWPNYQTAYKTGMRNKDGGTPWLALGIYAWWEAGTEPNGMPWTDYGNNYGPVKSPYNDPAYGIAVRCVKEI
jgi:hypothetical protein